MKDFISAGTALVQHTCIITIERYLFSKAPKVVIEDLGRMARMKHSNSHSNSFHSTGGPKYVFKYKFVLVAEF